MTFKSIGRFAAWPMYIPALYASCAARWARSEIAASWIEA
jgi:hypothetical protein